jgi:hypothetical protein
MPCQVIDLGNGHFAHIRTSAPKRKRCSVCKQLCMARLCDAVIAPGRTCDAPLCPRCAYHVAPDTDYCPKHAPQQYKLGLEVA